MVGQGCPRTSRGVFATAAHRAVCRAWSVAPPILLVVLLASTAAAETTMRIRIAWGGGSERLWHGNVALTQGRLSQPRPQGIEADEPGSMWLGTGLTYVHPLPSDLVAEDGLPTVQPEHLVIRQRSPRTYDAVDLVVSALPDAKLLVELVPVDDSQNPNWIVIPLSELLEGVHTSQLDDQGNQLQVHRRPDDDLRIETMRENLVFAPGEALEFDLVPYLPAVESGTELRIQMELTPARGSDALWSSEHTATAGQPVPIRQRIVLPEQEGAYDVVITARRAPGLHWPPSVSAGLKWKRQPLAERKIQVLVLRPEQPQAPLAGQGEPEPVVVEIDPTNSRSWERFAKLSHLRRGNRRPRGPMGNSKSRTQRHPLGQVVRLERSQNPADVAWEAYPMPIDDPGLPHVLEVDYPSDTPQTMGISIIEPNAAGSLFPIGLDSGVDLAEDVAVGTEPLRWLTHRMVFWPRTKAPIVLVTNRRDGAPAMYGKIRVRSFGGSLPRAFDPREPAPPRLLAAYLDRPLFPENHTAEEAIGSLSDLGVDDWLTFYQGGTRLVAYLNHVGYGGLMIAALADGSAIYPSRLLEPTPRYDTGAFLPRGQDPVRKDVLEMLFRLFDRDRLELIPALEFAAPLPELEAVLRHGGPQSDGIRWIGPQGLAWTETHPPMRGLAPYYNVLDPQVQEAMLKVARELVTRYGHHASFSGLAIQLSAHGYAQLPGPEWGVDDATIARFERDTGVRLAGTGPRRFAARAQALSTEHLSPWLAWRAAQLGRFFRQLHRETAAVRADARLYLAGANIFNSEQIQRQLQPALPKRMNMAEALLRVGIDASQYGTDGGIVLLRPEQIVPRWSLASQAVNLEIRQMDDVDRYFQALATPGSLFFHKPQELRLASFDEQSPFKRSYTWLATQAVPSAAQNRRRFVHALASLDAQLIFDGGWQLSMGQEDALADLLAAYRRLPAVRFEPFVDPSGRAASQPVTVRYATHAGSTYLYAVNEAPFSTTARLQLACPAGCRVEELSGRRQVAPLRSGPLGTEWTVQLAPYDLVAVRLSAPTVKLVGVDVSWPDEVQKTLHARIADLGDRTAALRNPPLLDGLANPGFESPLTGTGRIPGWAASKPAGVSAGLDKDHCHGGGQSLCMASTGPVASLVSEPFDAPATGRLNMSVWLRTAGTNGQPPLRLALVGKHKGRDLFHFVHVGQNPAQQVPPAKIGPEWQPLVVEFRDLPLENLSHLQLRFDLMGAGEVWMDDVQLSALAFSKNERVELFKLIAPAQIKLQEGQVGDCLELLEGYWPRFLVANVPLVELPKQPKPRPNLPHGAVPPASPVETGLLDRMKDSLPGWLRF